MTIEKLTWQTIMSNILVIVGLTENSVARHKVTRDVWLEHGENLVKHGKSKGSEKSRKAIESISSNLSKLKNCEKNQSDSVVDEINKKIEGVDSDIWNRWKGRIRTKKASENKIRRDISESSLHYICDYKKEKGINDDHEILNSLGKSYFIIDLESNEFLNDILNIVIGEGPATLKSHEVLKVIKKGLVQRNINTAPMLVYWSSGKDMDSGDEYEFRSNNESKKAGYALRTDENNNTTTVRFVDIPK